MKLKSRHKNIFIILLLSLLFFISIFIVYKELFYFNRIENFENPNNIPQPTPTKSLTQQQIRRKTSEGQQKLKDLGFLKTININNENKAATKNLEVQLDILKKKEYKLSQDLKNFNNEVENKRSEIGKKNMQQTLDVISNATSHFKPITDNIKKHANAMSSSPPPHLDNDPTSTDPDKPYDPTKPASWWSAHGSTPEFYQGNYIPLAATNCTQVQCAPDGFELSG